MTGYDDLAKIRPTAPGGSGPDWPQTKQQVLDEILTARVRRGRGPARWLAAAAAAAVIVAAVAVGIQLGNGPQVALPADSTASPSPMAPAEPSPSAESPSPPSSESPPASEPSMIASGVLFDLDGAPALCAGMILESYPPQCGGALVPLAGLAWEDVPTRRQEGERVWSEMTVLVGEDDGTTFRVARAYAADDPAAPTPSGAGVALPQDFSPLCEEPVVGSGPAAGPEGLAAAASALPGYVGLWISPDQTTLNVAFTEGADEASALLAPTVGAAFCAGTVEGITAADAAAATTALGEIVETAGILGYGHSFDRTGSWLEVSVVRETPEVMSTINEAIGPDAARHLRLSARIPRR